VFVCAKKGFVRVAAGVAVDDDFQSEQGMGWNFGFPPNAPQIAKRFTKKAKEETPKKKKKKSHFFVCGKKHNRRSQSATSDSPRPIGPAGEIQGLNSLFGSHALQRHFGLCHQKRRRRKRKAVTDLRLLQVSAYGELGAGLEDGTKLTKLRVREGDSGALWLGNPSPSDLPKDANPNDVLIGQLKLFKVIQFSSISLIFLFSFFLCWLLESKGWINCAICCGSKTKIKCNQC
jgi:hypothetical protein